MSAELRQELDIAAALAAMPEATVEECYAMKGGFGGREHVAYMSLFVGVASVDVYFECIPDVCDGPGNKDVIVGLRGVRVCEVEVHPADETLGWTSRTFPVNAAGGTFEEWNEAVWQKLEGRKTSLAEAVFGVII